MKHTIETLAKNIHPFPSIPVFLLGVAFLLFPIAHLSVFGFPLYLSEGFIFLSIITLFFQYTPKRFFAELWSHFVSEKHFFLFTLLFLVGITLSLLLNYPDVGSLGKLKSFYIVPIIFAALIPLALSQVRDFRFLLYAWLLGALSAAVASLIVASEGIFLYDGRLAGPYQSANYLALLVAPTLLISVFLFLTSHLKVEKISLFVCGLLLTFTLFLTHSYGVWLGIGVCMVVSMWILARKKKRLFLTLLFSGIAFLSILFLLESNSEKWQSLISFDERSSLASRLMIWQVAGDIASENPLFGIGTGKFQETYLEYQQFYPPYLEWAVPTPHNLYVHFLLEGGVLTLFSWIGIIGVLGFRFKRLWLVIEEKSEIRSYALFASILVIFYLSYGLVDTPYMKNDLTLAVWGSIGFFLASLKLERHSVQS